MANFLTTKEAGMPRNFTKKLTPKVTTPKPAVKAKSKGKGKGKAKPSSKTKAKKQPAKKKAPKLNSLVAVLAETFTDPTRIRILEENNAQLQKTIDAFNAPDKPYGHNKSIDYLMFGRTKSQYAELIKIARHIRETTPKMSTKVIEQIENFPIKTRDKFILLLEVVSDLNDSK